MNAVVFDSGDIVADGRVRLLGARARHVLGVLGAAPGATVKLARLGGGLHLAARVVETATSPEPLVVLVPGPESPPPPRCPADLLLALPRPKCLKRLWPQIAALGPARVYVTAGEKVEKSYWGCTWLREREREALMREGLAQAVDSALPEVSIERRLKPFVEDVAAARYGDGARFYAHPPGPGGDGPGDGGPQGFAAACAAARAGGSPVLVAVGPEGGWTPFETALFERCGFARLDLGPRVLRTDTAVVSLLSLASASVRLR